MPIFSTVETSQSNEGRYKSSLYSCGDCGVMWEWQIHQLSDICGLGAFPLHCWHATAQRDGSSLSWQAHGGCPAAHTNPISSPMMIRTVIWWDDTQTPLIKAGPFGDDRKKNNDVLIPRWQFMDSTVWFIFCKKTKLRILPLCTPCLSF